MSPNTVQFSIITTCFNAAKTIEQTIQSVISSSAGYKVEHIITDAGSTDGTLDIIQKYKEHLTIVEATGLNQSQGINCGLKAATGQIVSFLNADDTYQSDTLQLAWNAFSKEPEKRWLIGRCKIIDQNDQELQPWITAYKNVLLSSYSYPLLLCENFICQPSVFLKPSLFPDYGYFAENQNLVMDYEFWLRIGHKEQPIIINKQLSSFRRFMGTKSNANFVQQFKDDKAVAAKYARMHGHSWTIAVKYLNYLRTIGIYKILYRA